ncbi:hypothetical protein NDU88_005247 [Pleurodeles waltl]|uniref:Uncharacterized protein n=1 Tax=Pleurodeles waltl TaxID=8319 RepID=A0AAV7SL51_PLEWA|nr:hypothetical protein NDU88_005247 [Pleurodeles waltl]
MTLAVPVTECRRTDGFATIRAESATRQQRETTRSKQGTKSPAQNDYPTINHGSKPFNGLNGETPASHFPPMELQRTRRLGPMCKCQEDRPCPIITCCLRHDQARKLLTAARTHVSYRYEDRELRMAPDFSRDINEKQRAFLALRPQLLQLDIKFGLFKPAQMIITKDGKSKDFLDAEALRQSLDNLLPQPMDSSSAAALTKPGLQETSSQPQHHIVEQGSAGPQSPRRNRPTNRPLRSHEDRKTALQVVADLTHDCGRDNSRSQLKPVLEWE